MTLMSCTNAQCICMYLTNLFVTGNATVAAAENLRIVFVFILVRLNDLKFCDKRGSL